MLNRRHLFGVTGAAVAAAAVPTIAAAREPEPWDVLIAGLTVLDPFLASQARDARAQGFEVSELYMVCRTVGEPFLLFRKSINGVTGPTIFDGTVRGDLN